MSKPSSLQTGHELSRCKSIFNSAAVRVSNRIARARTLCAFPAKRSFLPAGVALIRTDLRSAAVLAGELIASEPILRPPGSSLEHSPLPKRQLAQCFFSVKNKYRMSRQLRGSTAATLALTVGVSPKVVTEQLGHTSAAFTLDVYSHVLPHMQDDAAAKVEAALMG